MQDLKGERVFSSFGFRSVVAFFIGRGEVVIEERIGFHSFQREGEFLCSRKKDECSLTRW